MPLYNPPASGLEYSVYVALLSQSGTDAPIATVLHNTLGEVVFARTGTGQYSATLAGAFTTGKTAVFTTGNGISQFGIVVAYLLTSEDVITLKTIDCTDSFAPADAKMADTSIEIRVYP